MEAETKKRGCGSLILGVVLFFLGLFVFESAVDWVFHRVFPADAITKTFIPFQNNYLAFTDAYLTNEGMTSEFSNDTSATMRFLGIFVLAIFILIVITVLLYIIPFTRKWMDYLVYRFYLPVIVLLLLYCYFFPETQTVFDRERKTMTVTRYDWMFFGQSAEVPFNSIADFVYEKYDMSTYSDGHTEFVLIYALIGDKKISIGENQVGSHPYDQKEWELAPDKKAEAEALIQALKKMTGLTN